MSGTRKIDRDHYLFREGDAPDAMYVVKSGKFAVVKSKNNSEIILAEIGVGSMVGEMAFFDNKPRSASVKALKDSEVITLPYKALHVQFKNMPEWSKAIMRTVNDHLRKANVRLKELEKVEKEDEVLFPPHTITKLTAILNFVGMKYGKPHPEGLLLNANTVRVYTIQVFQEPTHKMQKLVTALSELKYARIEELGEGRQQYILLRPEALFTFTEWYNEILFKKEEDRINVKEEEVRLIGAAHHFAQKLTPDEKGFVKLNLTEIQNRSMQELGSVVRVEDLAQLTNLKVVGQQMMEPDGVCVQATKAELEKQFEGWSLIYHLKRVRR
jgi:CRP/FNR family transcriptional regulator, cyclic AMP receptor protein